MDAATTSKKQFAVRGSIGLIEVFDSLSEAEQAVLEHQEEDKHESVPFRGFYEILAISKDGGKYMVYNVKTVHIPTDEEVAAA